MRGSEINTVVDWDVFLEDDAAIDGLIDFIEERANNRELWAACGTAACKTEVDRMRALGNWKSRSQARKFLSQYYSWE